MSGVRRGRVTFYAWPNDHDPPHVHAFIAGHNVIIELRADRSVAVAHRRRLRQRRLRASDLREVLDAAADAFDELIALWERMHR